MNGRTNNPNNKLSEADVEVIRRLGARGYNSRQIADVFDVRPCTVRKILTGGTWKEPNEG